LAPLLKSDPEGIPDSVTLNEPWSLELFNRTPDPVTTELMFDGATRAPPKSEVLEQYRTEVAYADHYFGELQDLFTRLGLQDKTLWVVASDHGEGLFRHGIRAHATSVYEDQLRILWMMKGAAIPRGLRIQEQPVLVEDLAPTILDLVGIRPPAGLTGLSQASCWTDAGCKGRRNWYAFGAKSHPQKITAVAGYQWPLKLLYRPKQKRKSGLFNLLEDPWEAKDLRSSYRNVTAEEQFDLQEYEERLKETRQTLQGKIESADHSHLSPAQLHALRALGYLGD
jgi:arylsulfatase A-like enzyme